ncbi:hypothetical protein BJX70DRAFT_374639 [Aspergillus crustosus]
MQALCIKSQWRLCSQVLKLFRAPGRLTPPSALVHPTLQVFIYLCELWSYVVLFPHTHTHTCRATLSLYHNTKRRKICRLYAGWAFFALLSSISLVRLSMIQRLSWMDTPHVLYKWPESVNAEVLAPLAQL